jgi:hypothetical protein
MLRRMNHPCSSTGVIVASVALSFSIAPRSGHTETSKGTMEPFDLSKHMNMPTAIIGGVVLFFIVRGVFQWFEDKEQPPVLPKPVVAKQTPPPMRDFTLECQGTPLCLVFN